MESFSFIGWTQTNWKHLTPMVEKPLNYHLSGQAQHYSYRLFCGRGKMWDYINVFLLPIIIHLIRKISIVLLSSCISRNFLLGQFWMSIRCFLLFMRVTRTEVTTPVCQKSTMIGVSFDLPHIFYSKSLIYFEINLALLLSSSRRTFFT